MRWLVQRFAAVTRPLVWRVAALYNVRIDRHCVADGQNPLIIEDDEAARRLHIPATVRFNTRSGTIRVGANTVFGEDVQVLTGEHFDMGEAQRRGVPLHHVPESGRDITIGRGCYIGGRAIVIGPVTIGDYAVVGAGAVVTKDVAPRTFVAGVPARVVREV